MNWLWEELKYWRFRAGNLARYWRWRITHGSNEAKYQIRG